MKNFQLTRWVKAILTASGILLIAVLFVPMWKIELSAPQYPEGLVLKIFPNKLDGSVGIINGLNHYIGMKTLHTKDFIEFTILPFIIGFFGLCCFVVAFLNKKKWLIAFLSLFIIFGVVAMIDFWRWEYNYGHDLNPEAAIQIPGMAYQPPLIGYKQLLNFGAYSVPDIGGYLFILVGLLLVLCIIIQIVKEKKQNRSNFVSRKAAIVAASVFLFLFASCNAGPQPIKIGVDACSFCKMTFADNKFGGEIITKKNKIFKFDDLSCLISFKKSASFNKQDIKGIYLVSFDGTHNFIEASKAHLLKSDELRSPMGGNIAAFADEQSLQSISKKFKGNPVSWEGFTK
ncbi:MAG: nitrous oxide reductase accessory protein NosL [Ginsengibacter sp.]